MAETRRYEINSDLAFVLLVLGCGAIGTVMYGANLSWHYLERRACYDACAYAANVTACVTACNVEGVDTGGDDVPE